MKKLILTLFIFALTLPLIAIEQKSDSSIIVAKQLAVEKANVLIDKSSLNDSTKNQVKAIISDVPEAVKDTQQIVKIFENQNQYSSKLEYYLYLLGGLITFLTTLATIVKKIRSLPHWISPISWFEKITGEHKAELNGEKGTYKKVFVPEGKKIEISAQ